MFPRSPWAVLAIAALLSSCGGIDEVGDPGVACHGEPCAWLAISTMGCAPRWVAGEPGTAEVSPLDVPRYEWTDGAETLDLHITLWVDEASIRGDVPEEPGTLRLSCRPGDESTAGAEQTVALEPTSGVWSAWEGTVSCPSPEGQGVVDLEFDDPLLHAALCGVMRPGLSNPCGIEVARQEQSGPVYTECVDPSQPPGEGGVGVVIERPESSR